jgi:hypothetical protein
MARVLLRCTIVLESSHVSDILDRVTVRMARSGRKQKIGNAHILAAMVNAGEPVLLGDPRNRARDRRRADDSGRAELTVIHAMPTGLRRRP